MKTFIQHITEAQNKPVAFTFGRFNPITKGHGELIDFVVKTAKGGEGMIFTSASQDAKKNPLDYNQKIKYLKKFFKKATIIKNTKIKTPFHVLDWLSEQGYKDVTMVVGGDRVAEFEKRIRPYVEDYGFEKFKVVNSGNRKEGVSGTDMRNHVKNGDMNSFVKGLPKGVSKKDGENFFNDVKSGMGISEYLEIGTDETTKEYKKKTPGEIMEGTLKDIFKAIIGKKTMHTFNRAVHEKKYKQAMKLYHSMIQHYNRSPESQNSSGVMVMNPKGLALAKAAQMVGISTKELKKVLDKKTRYESFEDFNLTEQISKTDLDTVERFADKVFAKVGIDVEFTKHFLDRVNDARNGKEITVAELTRLFKQTYKKHGKKIAKMGDDTEAVLNDLQTDINLPFVLNYDPNMDEFDLVSKTVMRKKNFKTNDPKLKV